MEHPELEPFLEETTLTIRRPEHREPDARAGRVLYVRSGESRPAADVYGTPEGLAVRFDEHVSVITMVNARWLAERDGKITITVPNRIETSAKELGPLLAGA